MPTHDEICSQAVEAFNNVSQDEIVSAFVGSLSTRNLAARSAFGSYVVLQHFTRHEFVATKEFSSDRCAYCGLGESTTRTETIERVLKYPFQTHHTDIQYAAFDLATFRSRNIDAPTDEDRQRLRAMFEAIRSLPTSAQLTELNHSLQGIFKSNKHERMILLETLGYAGILCPKNQRDYHQRFVTHDFANSHQPSEYYKREWSYPVRFWTGVDAVNEKRITHYFGEHL